MAILVDGSTKVICQGITGASGAFHTKGCLDYGTQIVGGVTPRKGGQQDANGLPIMRSLGRIVLHSDDAKQLKEGGIPAWKAPKL